MAEEKRALRLNAGQFTRLIKVTRATSRYPERDVLVLMLGHHCGLRVTEISRITVADVMQASGKLRQEVSLREAVTKGCRQRCTYLSSRALIEALEAYLAYRMAHGIGTELEAARYRGLLPQQPLIYSGRGAALIQPTSLKYCGPVRSAQCRCAYRHTRWVNGLGRAQDCARLRAGLA